MSNTTQTPVTIICGDCGIGVYLADPFGAPCWECAECGHRVASSDIDLEAGETLTTDDTGALAYIPAAN